MSASILQVQGLHYTYPDGTLALRGLSTDIARGKKIALLGANGAGKSTFLLHLIGILKPFSGKILLHGEEVKYNRKALHNLRSKVGFVFQDPDTQLFSASVWQEVSFGPINLGLSKEEVKARVIKALDDTGITSLKDKPTHFLSYGQKKLVSIADILAMEPEVLIFDEPTASLDPRYTKHVMELLDQLNQSNITIIMATHCVDIAYGWADWVLVMKEGIITKEGTPEEIFTNDQLLISTNLSRPFLLEVFQELSSNNYLPRNISLPKKMADFKKILQENAPKNK
ncbi:energy-coupling factor ABC transporter ATP-binding protein [Desulforamulus aquiferis]|uniref:ABC transporter ATP-binding protein n=1 Tax=Desulforamulus aquiferis TaxID=1397668 RepID=A0AAW7ZF02_9FIRM|nr:ATP-binding cassette domain-containing protein [Desulforamulus aquiferis]MDO7787837.1 ATP-binding cassette domain-containing protein [Desulforamulus aquiferis]RYD04038.1 hypothetical protein N752_16745 [Desulforamulus aquiferis]